MELDNTLILSIITQVATAGAVYGAIKADIKHIYRELDHHRDVHDNNSARIREAHERINNLNPLSSERRSVVRNRNAH